jgi:hypothetical protein
MGGTLVIVAADQVEKELIENVERLLTQHLPRHDGERPKLDKPSEGSLERGTAPKKTVFLSYTWDPVHQRPTEDPADTPYYEEPVNAIEEGLASFTGRDGPLVLLRDKTSMKPGDYITEFIEQCAKAELCIVVFSDKYLRSWWCMIELSKMYGSLIRQQRSIDQSVLFVKHKSIAGNQDYPFDAIVYWKWQRFYANPMISLWFTLLGWLRPRQPQSRKTKDTGFDNVPVSLPSQLAKEPWRYYIHDFVHILGTEVVTLPNRAKEDIYRPWDPAQKDQILKWILDKLDLPPKS